MLTLKGDKKKHRNIKLFDPVGRNQEQKSIKNKAKNGAQDGIQLGIDLEWVVPESRTFSKKMRLLKS